MDFPSIAGWHGTCSHLGPIMTTRPRILVASPHLAECEALADWMCSEGFDLVRTSTSASAADEIQARAFDLLVADFAFAFRDGLHAASRARACNLQTPTVVIGESDPAAQAHAERHRAMYLSRPVERTSLVCTISMAIMEGRPARRSPRKTISRFDALVNGAPSYIVDVSNEGLRLEIPQDRRSSALPPYFSVWIAMIGVALKAQRIWANAVPGSGRTGMVSCGATLSKNQSGAEQAWCAFVDTVPAHEGSSQSPCQVQ